MELNVESGSSICQNVCGQGLKSDVRPSGAGIYQQKEKALRATAV